MKSEWLVAMIRAQPGLSLGVSILLMVSVVLAMVPSGRCLKTHTAPAGIVSFELTWTKGEASKIRNEWESGYCNSGVISFKPQQNVDSSVLIINKAKQNIFYDYAFLIAYTLFFVVAIILLDADVSYRSDVTLLARKMIFAAIAAGLLDAIENAFMLLYLQRYLENTFVFNLAATVKFVLVLVVIVHIIVTFVRRRVVNR